MNDKTREAFVRASASTNRVFKQSGMSMRRFLRKCRAEIDSAIAVEQFAIENSRQLRDSEIDPDEQCREHGCARRTCDDDHAGLG